MLRKSLLAILLLAAWCELGQATGCYDKLPPSTWPQNTCEAQQAAGNCVENWFLNHAKRYCELTCGKCADVGDIQNMTFKGGSKEEWLYVDETNEICISTTAESDPCMGRISFPSANATTMSFGLLPAKNTYVDVVNPSEGALAIVTPSEGALGFAGQQDIKACTMMNKDSGPLQSAIASGQLLTAWTTTVVTVKSNVDEVVEFRMVMHNGNTIFLQGKLSCKKVSVCVGVVYKYSNDTRVMQGSDCSVRKSFTVTACKNKNYTPDGSLTGVESGWEDRSACSAWKLERLETVAAQLV